jgi:hypothetical protein
MFTIGALTFLRDTTWSAEGQAGGVPILAPEASTLVPVVIGLLIGLAALHVAVVPILSSHYSPDPA